MIDFNQAAANWDGQADRRRHSEEVATAILAQAGLSTEAEVLEFGCGTGVMTFLLRPHVRTVTATDTAQGMLKVVGEKIRTSGVRGVRTHLLQGVAGEELPACDAIVSNMALHHIADLPELFGRFYASLRPGGTVALADLEPDGGLFHPDPAGVFHNGFEHATLQKWLEDAGFSAVRFYETPRMRKKAADGVEREFAFFLAVAQK